MGVLYPNTVANLLDGPVRALWAPASVVLPDDISDIISMVYPYTPKTNWTDFGATTDASSYSRDMSSEDYQIEQETGAVFSKVTEVTRQFTLPVAEITADTMQMLEEGGVKAAVAAAAGVGAQTRVGFGGISSLTRYRMAFIAQRDPGFGTVVNEPGGRVRGPFIGLVGYQVSLAATGSSLDIAKGALSSREVTFTLYPDASVASTKDNTGCFLFEAGGTIT